MKRIVLSILVGFFFVSINASVEINGIYYNLIKKANAAEVTYDYSNPYSGNLIIPSEIEYEGVTYTVTAIDRVGSNNSITSVTIPNTVTSIKNSAFYGCKSLKEITIPNSVTSIGEEAFASCSELTKASLPDDIKEIPDGMFKFCYKLEIIEIPAGVTLIGIEAFYACYAIKSLKLPYGLNTIGAQAFKSCKGLTEIEIPTALFIGVESFYGCSKLSKIVLGKKIMSILSKAFANCEELADFYCYLDELPSTSFVASNIFSGSQVNYATLHVPGSLVNDYNATIPWSEFGKVVAITDVENAVDKVYNDSTEEHSHFTLNGQRIGHPSKGLNIIRYGDGHIRKVLVK